jgi:hypothetical protein
MDQESATYRTLCIGQLALRQESVVQEIAMQCPLEIHDDVVACLT